MCGYVKFPVLRLAKTKSLKLFATKKPQLNYVWSDDIDALKLLYPDYEYTVVKAWKFTPTFPRETLAS